MSDDASGSTAASATTAKRNPWIAVTWVLAVVVLILAGYLLLNPNRRPGIAGDGGNLSTVLFLCLAFAAGTALIFVFLIAFAFVSHRIDKGGAHVRGALSLPHGSISAILALIILVVFSVTSIHLFSEIRAGEGTGIASRGVTQEALTALPADRVLSVQAEPTTGGQPATYTVSLSTAHETSSDFAAELMILFSTLLVAIVGFYFGQRATAAGIREGTAGIRERNSTDQRAAAEGVTEALNPSAPG